AIEERLASLMRWNALAMVVRANQAYGELGGHIASYASAADLFEVGFNHFFRAKGDHHGGDLVFYQPHSAPAREGLDNLTWVVNCNLQRLDGPVRGNGRIIDELEALFSGAGWNVIKLVWGSDWDALFARDHDGSLVRALSQTVDGQFQTFAAKDG
nr:hypothetical protein [Tanacetum cinerariifolium]